jgi:RNA polymerase sigma-70 factor (ECF subfamily)
MLPTALRRALTLHYLLDRSVAEIAVETGASAGTVKSWLSRGRTALAAALGTNNNNDATLPTGGSDAR